MEFIDIPTEQTTAATDAFLAIIALVSAIYLYRFSKNNKWKAILWACLLSLLAFASALGTIVHGLKISNMLKIGLWRPLNLTLGLIVGIFTVAVVYDIWGENAARRTLPVMLFVGAGFFCITLIYPESFLVFIIYEAVGMLFALGGYIFLACRRHIKGAWVMVMGILVTILAAAVQAVNSFSFVFIWSFDHNGIYHLFQIVGIVLLVTGITKMLYWNLPGNESISKDKIMEKPS